MSGCFFFPKPENTFIIFLFLHTPKSRNACCAWPCQCMWQPYQAGIWSDENLRREKKSPNLTFPIPTWPSKLGQDGMKVWSSTAVIIIQSWTIRLRVSETQSTLIFLFVAKTTGRPNDRRTLIIYTLIIYLIIYTLISLFPVSKKKNGTKKPIDQTINKKSNQWINESFSQINQIHWSIKKQNKNKKQAW